MGLSLLIFVLTVVACDGRGGIPHAVREIKFNGETEEIHADTSKESGRLWIKFRVFKEGEETKAAGLDIYYGSVNTVDLGYCYDSEREFDLPPTADTTKRHWVVKRTSTGVEVEVDGVNLDIASPQEVCAGRNDLWRWTEPAIDFSFVGNDEVDYYTVQTAGERGVIPVAANTDTNVNVFNRETGSAQTPTEYIDYKNEMYDKHPYKNGDEIELKNVKQFKMKFFPGDNDEVSVTLNKQDITIKVNDCAMKWNRHRMPQTWRIVKYSDKIMITLDGWGDDNVITAKFDNGEWTDSKGDNCTVKWTAPKSTHFQMIKMKSTQNSGWGEPVRIPEVGVYVAPEN